ncbi:hypothetical protein BD413DRAFT_604199 [Trametes elegans]|nr:hypothetical protein BD413DRAFT_604199 [Trametes elegans]
MWSCSAQLCEAGARSSCWWTRQRTASGRAHEAAAPRGELISWFTVQKSDVLKPCLTWSNSGHLAVDEIYKAPIFEKSLKVVSSIYGQANYVSLSRIIGSLAEITKERGVSSCVIITRPPEIIACFCIVDGPSRLFVIFDSHPRPNKHPDGAAFIFHKSLNATARYLSELLHYDEGLLRETDVQWEAQLLAHCSGDIFIAADPPVRGEQWAETALGASLQALSLRAQVRELETKNRELEGEKKRLKQETISLESDLLRLEEAVRKERAKVDRFRQLRHPTKEKTAQRGRNGQRARAQDDLTRNAQRGAGTGEDADLDMLAVQLQIAYDEEDRQLAEQFKYLQGIQPDVFECGICFEQYEEDHVARVHPCGHSFCRECLNGYAISKIDEHRYPILCPQCTADRTATNPAGGALDDDAVQKLGLTEKQYEVYVEMQMAVFSIIIDCRKCGETLFVDKAEYQQEKIIHCPLGGCGGVWCKQCSQLVDPKVPEHTCDGTNELEHLMKQQGWKHCPGKATACLTVFAGCKTPAEKIAGCNFMSCRAPGCNTHFCYKCGQFILQSALPIEIATAKSKHYITCTI